MSELRTRAAADEEALGKAEKKKLVTVSPPLETCVPVRTPELSPGWSPALPAAAC